MPDSNKVIAPRTRPFLKWAGGKSRLLPQYAPYFPQDFATYFEPFCGGGAVFFHSRPVRAVLSDINPELVNVYSCVRDHVAAVIACLVEHAACHSETYYYAVRALPTTILTPVERAARFIYLNHTCFNGLYRENARGDFNVPMGRYQRPAICDAANLHAASVALHGVELLVASFDHVLARAQPGDLVYFDPPYHPVSASSSFTAYSRFSFGVAQQQRLYAVFAELARRGIHALISNSDCPFTRELYADYRMVAIAASRAINSRADKRGKITELLVMNW